MKVVTARKRKKRKAKKSKRRSVSRRKPIFMMGANPVKRRKRRSRVKHSARRVSRHKNYSSKIDIVSILVDGAIATAGAMATVFLTNVISRTAGGLSQQTKNLLMAGVGIAGGYLLSKTQFRQYSKPILIGAMVVTMANILKTSFGTDIFTTVAGENTIADIVDNLDLSQVGYSSSNLLGISEVDGLGIIEGEDVEAYL